MHFVTRHAYIDDWERNTTPSSRDMTILRSNLSSLMTFGLALAPTLAFSLAGHEPKPLVVDIDIFSAVDDVGALAAANVLHNCGMADLKAMVVNTGSEYRGLAVDVS